MKQSYLLDIVGESDRMTEEAKERLQAWRIKALRLAERNPGRVFLNGPDSGRIALTFDDGPDDKVTPAIAETLSRYGVKGSFFFIGSRVEQYPNIVRKVHEAGHLVLNHSYDHARLTTLDEPALLDNLRRAQLAIRAAIGKEPALFRPPFGDADDRVFQAADRIGCRTALWSLDTLDWSQKEEEHIRWNVDTFVRPGEIVLMHSSPGCAETAKALPGMVESALRKGLQLVDLQELLGVPAYQA